MNFDAQLKEYGAAMDDFVLNAIPGVCAQAEVLRDAMAYSLSSGGKRIRPVLCLAFAELFGASARDALWYASAVEFVHTYSLIHDDLPCMDNDDMRRGKPSSHIQFGEATALLTGDALLTHAFTCIVRSGLPSDRDQQAVAELSKYAGIDGMIGGQIVDLAGEQTAYDLDTLMLMDSMKTGALITAACCLGCVAAGVSEIPDAVRRFGMETGLAFQIRDDILDYLEGEENSDIVSGKSTYVSLLGIEDAQACAARHTEKALEALTELPGDTAFLRELTMKLLDRTV